MYDKERIGRIVGDIDRFFSDLDALGIKDVRDVEDKKTFYAASMLLFSLINRAIDLGEELITANHLGTPATYKDVFFLLYRAKLINSGLKDDLVELSSFRNLFSHEYHSFTPEDILDAHARIGAVRELVKRAKKTVA